MSLRPVTSRPAPPGRILVLGCGSVAQCTVPLLTRELGVEPARVTILDMVDNRSRVADQLACGVRYELTTITPENLHAELSRRVGPGDIVLDLAWNIDTATIVDWCRRHGVRYLNTSVELWDPYAGAAARNPLARTLYARHMQLRRMVEHWGDNAGPTAVVEHGANPGLVSHFAKRALREIGERLLHDGLAVGHRRAGLEDALSEGDAARLAMLSGTKVIHISERDTQISDAPKEVGEFVNTWSVEGFYEEGVAPAELGWGTHERRLPDGAFVHTGYGPCNQICIARPGMTTWVRSWVPCGPIIGMVIRHGEAFTLCDHLTVWDDHGSARYRPTVHYAYCPSDAALNSVHELQMRQWDLQPHQRIMNDEIVSGRDELGVLLLGHDYTGWWTGSLLSIEETRAILPGQNATTLQVAASVIAAVAWMCDNPSAGLLVPDDLPWEEVLAVALPYLGTFHSGPTDWEPVSTRNGLFDDFTPSRGDPGDPWQFANFVL